jgi:serine/threonine protein kinase
MSRSNDDERTVTGPVTGSGGAPEFAPSSSMSVHTLPEGTRIRDYQITGLIGEGGFGIVYLAYDVSLQRRVAIKEYLPSSIASRANASMAVVVKSARHQETFALGLKSFLNEARLLARFDHPSLVKVYRFWEENGTAYMVMPYYEGPTLKRVLAELGHAPDEAALRSWLRPLLDALAAMHAAHCFHRDIAPDNILLTPSGPLLLDFGAARRVIGDMTHALTVVLKPGFAPIEQYGESSAMTQGAWTDLYALASVVYAAVTGHAPVSSVERLMDDRLQPLSALAAGRYSETFLSAIDAALALRPKDRPQTVAAFRVLLDGGEAVEEPVVGFSSSFGAPLDSGLGTLQPEAKVPQRAAVPAGTRATAPTPTPAPLPARERAAAAPYIVLGDASAAMHASAAAPPRRRRTGLYVVAGTAGLMVLAAAVYYAGAGRSAPSAATPGASMAPPTIDKPAHVVAPASAAAPSAAPVVLQAPAPAPSPAPAVETRPEPVAESVPTPVVKAAPAPAVLQAAPPAANPAPAKPKREAPAADARIPEPRAPVAEPAARPATERAAPSNAAVSKARCSDILQKASLEPLSASEAEFLKKECR